MTTALELPPNRDRVRSRPVWKRRFRLFAWPWLLVSTCLLFQHDAAAQAKTNAAPALVSSNRFLFIVDTSVAMKNHGAAIVQALTELLQTRANNQLHPGDTIGVWTFNTELYVGQFPLQLWTESNAEDIANRITTFLGQQILVKKSRLAAALTGMARIIENSDVIAIVIISDGETKMTGTPFDDKINEAYKSLLRTMKRKPEPITTVLVAQAGKIIRYSVSALPFPIAMPDVPFTPIPIAPATPAPVAEIPPAIPAPAATAPPLILVGTATHDSETARPTTIPAPATNEVPARIEEKPAAVPTAQTPPPAAVTVPQTMVPAPAPPSTPIVTPTAIVASPPGNPETDRKSPPAQNVPAATAAQPPPAVPAAPPAQPSLAPATNSPPPAVALAAEPAQPGSNAYLIAGLLLLVMAVVLIILMTQRSRHAGPSLITRTANHWKK